MTSAAQIKAGEAWVGIHGKMGNLPDVLDKARDQVSGWAGSVEQLGDKVGRKFGSSIISGIVAFTALGAVDGALRKVAERMRDSAASGGSVGFEDVGEAIAEAIVSGVKAIPILGTITELSEQMFDRMLGSPMAMKARLEATERQRAAIQAALADVLALQDRIESQGGSPVASRIREINDEILASYNTLVRLGLAADAASDSLKGVRDAHMRQFGSEAEAAIASMRDGFAIIAGEIDADTLAAREFEKALRHIVELLQAAGTPTSEIADIEGQLRAEADAANVQRAAIESKERVDQAVERYQRWLDDRQDRINDLIKGIEAENDSFGKSQSQLLERELKRLGATQEEIDRALTAALDLEDKRRKAEAAAAPSSIVESMTASGTFSSGAFDAGSALETSALADSSRETARNTKRLVQLMERGGLVYGP